MQDNQALQEQEREGGEVEVDVKSHDNLTYNGEVANDSGDKHKDEAYLKTDLSHVVGIETAAMLLELSKC